MFVQANWLLYMSYKFKRLAGKLKLHHEYGLAKEKTIGPTTAKGKHQHVEGSWAEKHDVWDKTQVQPNLLTTSEVEEKNAEFSVRRRRQSPEPAKEQLPRQSLRRIQHTSLRFKFTHVYIHVLSNSNSKPLPIFNHSNQEVYKFKKTIYVYMPK